FDVTAPTPAPDPPPASVEVRGGGTARAGNRPVTIHVRARQDGAVASGELVFFDPQRRLHVRCERIRSVQKTAAGVTVIADGVAHQGCGAATHCTVTFDLPAGPKRNVPFTLQVGSAPPVSAILVHGEFTVR